MRKKNKQKTIDEIEIAQNLPPHPPHPPQTKQKMNQTKMSDRFRFLEHYLSAQKLNTSRFF
jgi:hypothetical protein